MDTVSINRHFESPKVYAEKVSSFKGENVYHQDHNLSPDYGIGNVSLKFKESCIGDVLV